METFYFNISKETISLAYTYSKNKTLNYIDFMRANKNYYLLGVFLYLIGSFYNFTINNYIIYTLYWIGLGILSTIGFGTGIHTGVFFLFPYILSIKDTAIECNSTNFNLLGENKFICHQNTNENTIPNLQIFYKTLVPTLLWGIGSSLGEIPPYYLASLAKNEMYTSNNTYIQLYYDKVVYYMNKYSFMTIMLLACWPNVTFDMCGIASGYCGVSMYTFITATIIGKAFIKSPIEAYVILFFYDKDYIHSTNYKNSIIMIILINVYYILFYITILYFLSSIIKRLAEKQKLIESKL